ncbi:hypothetical protein ONS95_003476 [Cadophora gregata]|uniref:uncharacterized protein n=1 Tax=Cadophora gregata TaxID=51156 RepID=UPI0026DB1074|nr:uncharacterized protein ONS95_003476 [Cadophora gregata]KAK0108684.1 hypothetical protein ONS95_003476 [Cadophora gregata]KAK0108726.1 hypothetical protein ONS96_002572 [Cadophora gregata f. sp. sojae]
MNNKQQPSTIASKPDPKTPPRSNQTTATKNSNTTKSGISYQNQSFSVTTGITDANNDNLSAPFKASETSFYIGTTTNIDRYTTGAVYSYKKDTFSTPTTRDPFLDQDDFKMGILCHLCNVRYPYVESLNNHLKRSHGVREYV